jgi:hypothetical protein
VVAYASVTPVGAAEIRTVDKMAVSNATAVFLIVLPPSGRHGTAYRKSAISPGR